LRQQLPASPSSSFSNPSKNRGILQILVMARGNQRDKAREANQKKMAEQKKSNAMSGTEMQREKERVAKMMREKQAAADAKKAAEGATAKKK